MKDKQAITLAHLRERVDKLREALLPRTGAGQIVPEIIIAHHVESVVRAMFAYSPQCMANAMYKDEVCPRCVAALTNSSQETLLTREEVIQVLGDVVNGDLLETHLRVRLAKASLGPEGDEIFTALKRQHADSSHKRDYMNRNHRVPGSAFAGKRAK